MLRLVARRLQWLFTAKSSERPRRELLAIAFFGRPEELEFRFSLLVLGPFRLECFAIFLKTVSLLLVLSIEFSLKVEGDLLVETGTIEESTTGGVTGALRRSGVVTERDPSRGAL